MQLGAAVDDFLRFCALERRFSEHTTQAYRSDLADFSRALPPGIELAEVAPEVLRGYLEDMVGRRLSAATVRRRFACLRAFFRRAAALGRAPDPFGAWRPQLPRRKRLPRALSRPEVSVLVGALGADGRRRGPACRAELGLAVRLMLCTGLRVGELCRRPTARRCGSTARAPATGSPSSPTPNCGPGYARRSAPGAGPGRPPTPSSSTAAARRSGRNRCARTSGASPARPGSRAASPRTC
jgi:hypothetical protein